MVKSGGLDIVGHLDKIGLNASHYAPGIEESDFYRRRALELTDVIISHGCAVELNTKAYAEHGRFFPSEPYLDALLDADITVIVNSDAHRPECIDASRKEGLHLVSKLLSRANKA